MLLSLGLILLCQLIGEAIARATAIPVPGPVIGLVLCVLLLLARDRFPRFEDTGRGILSHLSLLFIPAGVGVIQRLDVIGGNALAIGLSIGVSTILALAVTAWVFSAVARRLS
jgi:holin-like protein